MRTFLAIVLTVLFVVLLKWRFAPAAPPVSPLDNACTQEHTTDCWRLVDPDPDDRADTYPDCAPDRMHDCLLQDGAYKILVN